MQRRGDGGWLYRAWPDWDGRRDWGAGDGGAKALRSGCRLLHGSLRGGVRFSRNQPGRTGTGGGGVRTGAGGAAQLR